jgi:hypothetical protein
VSLRLQHQQEDVAWKEQRSKKLLDGCPAEFTLRSLYLPKQGMFTQLPIMSDLGQYLQVPTWRSARMLKGPASLS